MTLFIEFLCEIYEIIHIIIISSIKGKKLTNMIDDRLFINNNDVTNS